MISTLRHLGRSCRVARSFRGATHTPRWMSTSPLERVDVVREDEVLPPQISAEEARKYRELHDVRLKGAGDDMESLAPLVSFDNLPFSPSLVNSMKRQGFPAPTAIQAQSWPIALAGRDMISIARTGSGKTCAFLLPAFQIISQYKANQKQQRGRRSAFSRAGPIALVLAPTRELAHQIQNEASKYCTSVGVEVASFYGGVSKGPQIRTLSRGVDVLVATPGRCNDLINMGVLDLSSVKYLVLDEADRMLDMGFEVQIRSIISNCHPERQSLFFTATWPRIVQTLALKYLKNPVTINIGDHDQLQANKAITQHIHVVKQIEKFNKLEKLLENLTLEAQERERQAMGRATEVMKGLDGPVSPNPKKVPKTLIFVGRKADCDDIAYDIRDAGYEVGSLHGDKTQEARAFIMQQYRRNVIKVLVATDVAARGLDITDIECVINFDFPSGRASGVENYVHRIGRTARGDRTGLAHSFFTPDVDAPLANDLIGILERSGQEVPAALRTMARPRQSGNNRRQMNSRRDLDDNFDMIGSKGRGSGARKNPRDNIRSSRNRDFANDDFDIDEDAFFRSGGFNVGNKSFGGEPKAFRSSANKNRRNRDDFF